MKLGFWSLAPWLCLSALASIDAGDAQQVNAEAFVTISLSEVEALVPTQSAIVPDLELSESGGIYTASDELMICPNCGETEYSWQLSSPHTVTCTTCSSVLPGGDYPADDMERFAHWQGGIVDMYGHRDESDIFFDLNGYVDSFKSSYILTALEDCAYTYTNNGSDRFAERVRDVLISYTYHLPNYASVTTTGHVDHDIDSNTQYIFSNGDYTHLSTLPEDVLNIYKSVSDHACWQELLNDRSYFEIVQDDFFAYLVNYSVAFPTEFQIWGNLGCPYISILNRFRSPFPPFPLAVHYIKRWGESLQEYHSVNYDGMMGDGVSYHYLWLLNNYQIPAMIIGAQDPDGYVDPVDGTTFDEPLTYSDVFPLTQYYRDLFFAPIQMTLPHGTPTAPHDMRVAGDGIVPSIRGPLYHGGLWVSLAGAPREQYNKILPGYGQISLGDGRLGDQIQTQLHYSNAQGSHSSQDSMTYQFYAHERTLFEFSGHQEYFKSIINKNTVAINHSGQNKYKADMKGYLDYYTPMFKGVSASRVNADHIAFYNYGSSGAVYMERFRRTLIQNTVDIDAPYVIDVFDVKGGEEHEYLLAGSMFYEQSASSSESMTSVNSDTPYVREDYSDDWSYFFDASVGAIKEDSYVDFTFDDRPEQGARVHLIDSTDHELYLSRLSRIEHYGEETQTDDRPHMLVRSVSPEGATEPLENCFIQVHEAYQGASQITEIEKIALTARSFALRIHLANRIDTYLISLDEACFMTYGDYRTDGVLAAFSEAQNSTLSDVWMVEGTYAKGKHREVTSSNSKKSMQITAVRRQCGGDENDAFTLNAELTAGHELAGQILLIDGLDETGHRTFTKGFTIDEVFVDSAGKSTVIVRQAAEFSVDGPALTELISPNKSAPNHEVRLLSNISTVPYISHISTGKKDWLPEAATVCDGHAFDEQLNLNFTAVPRNTTIYYSEEGNDPLEEGTALNQHLFITDDARLVFKLRNDAGLVSPRVKRERYYRNKQAIAGSASSNGALVTKLWNNETTTVSTILNSLLGIEHYLDYQITSHLYVPADGLYRFHLQSSGYRNKTSLSISNETIIDTKGIPYKFIGEVYLQKGFHPLVATVEGSKSFDLQWSYTGQEMTAIPTANLFTHFTPDSGALHAVDYTASEGGSIDGVVNQEVSDRLNGCPVVAVADRGYRFVAWSDGLTSPLRWDCNITEDKSYTAAFEVSSTDNGFLREIWAGLSGKDIADLTNSSAYPDNPTETSYIQIIDHEEEGVQYGERISGYICAPVSGEYIFEISADETAELWLSTNGSAADKERIAWLDGGSDKDTYDRYNTQTSYRQALSAGQVIYIEMLHKSDETELIDDAEDHCTARWWIPGLSEPVTISSAFTVLDGNSKTYDYADVLLTYFCDATHGSITGELEQNIPQFGTASTVVAVPASGYRFLTWSDGYVSASRQDSLVAQSRSLEALFTTDLRYLRYTAGSNGTIVGLQSQDLIIGTTQAETVTAVPSPGYSFSGWSDGITTTSRNDSASINDVIVTALFNLNDADTDSDSDGLSDVDELNVYGTNPDVPDTDYDGITDYWEIMAGSDPNDPASRIELDSDEDGLLDSDEIEHGTDRFNTDTDGDGFSDLEEVNAGLDPLVANPMKSINGLLAWYSMNETVGSFALDSSGNSNHASVTSAAFTSDEERDHVFRVTSDDITVPASVGESFTNEMTIAFWAKGDEGQSNNSIVYTELDGARLLNIHIPWDDAVYFDVGSIADGYDRVSTALPGDHTEIFHHWAFVKNATTGVMRIYLDGELAGTSTENFNSMTEISEMVFGETYKGLIDELCIFNKALDQSAIQMIFSDVDTDATTYYIDSVAGSDTNKGTTINTPWKSLTPANAVTLGPGDQVLLKADSVFKGQLIPQGSGSSESPIVIDRYGDGDDPRIDGESHYEATVWLENMEYLEVSHLEITNDSDTNATEKRRGLVVYANDYGTVNHVHLKNLFIHDVKGSLNKRSNEGVGLLLKCTGDTPSNFNDVLIEDCHLLRCDRNGIDMKSDFYQSDSYDPVTKTRSGGNWFPSTNVVIRNNLVEDIGGDCIKIISCDGALVEYNTATYGVQRCTDAAAGIWTWSADNCIIQYNESSYMADNQDGQGFDSDDNCVGNIFQYNYSHDNGGGFFLIIGVQPSIEPGSIGVRDTIIRYNVSQNDGVDGKYVFHITAGGTYDTHIYNNTVYCEAGRNVNLFYIGTWTGIPMGHTHVENNIFYADGTFDNNFETYTDYTFDNNVFYGTHLNADMGTNYLTSDPLLANAGGGTDGFDSLIAYIPASNSPAVDSGLVIADNGGLDIRGKTVPYGGTPDRGACEYSEEPVAAPDHYQVAMNQTLTVGAPGVLANDMGESSLTAELVDSASKGVVTFNADGSFIYIPNGDVTGDDTFTYQVISGATLSDVATVTVNVFGPSIEPDFIAHWTFDETAGITASDSSGHGNDGTLSGGSWVSGKIGGAVQLTSADVVDINGTQVTGDWTAAVWVYTTTGLSSGGHEDLLRSDTSNLALRNWQTGSVAYGHPGIDDWEFGYTVPADTWVHLTFVGDGTATVKLYVDGVYQASVTANMASSCPMDTIGLDMDAALDDLRIYGQALSPDEIEDLYMNIDTDGDGLTDAQEIALGTDPNDPDSGFGIDGSLPIPGKIQITWPSATGVLYRVWKSPDLVDWSVARDWATAATPPQDALEIDLSPTNSYFKVDANIQ